MLRKLGLWRGLSVVLGILLSLVIGFGTVAFANSGIVSNALGTPTTRVVDVEDGEVIDTQYFKSEYTEDGKPSDAGLEKLLKAEAEFCKREMQEGAVLLKNDGALPLKSDERRVSMFGFASADPLYKSFSAGGNYSGNRRISLYDAMDSAGFSINDTLFNAYYNSKGTSYRRHTVTYDRLMAGARNIAFEDYEEPLSFYTDTIKASYASDYNDVAIVVLAREAGEVADCQSGHNGITADLNGDAQLILHQKEKDMLNVIKDSGKFDKTILLVNSPNAMELHWMDDYGIDAALWIGGPGMMGFSGVPSLLTGEVSPSGKLVDTYATNSLSAPAMQNFGKFSYTNTASIVAAAKNGEAAGSVGNYIVNQEGIYIGYKYYETRYEDCILNRYTASGSAGIYASSGSNWNYADEVLYPFGYGLSYTEFKQTLGRVVVGSESVSVEVTVENLTDVEGKSVVQLYAQTPYEDYEKQNLIEKSAVQLIGYAKTDTLGKNETEIVTITVDKYLLASYDRNLTRSGSSEKGGYYLSKGNYYIAIGDNAHDALNNILAKKGASGMVDHEGKAVSGNADNVYHYTLNDADTGSYRYTDATGKKVTNRFDNADINHYLNDSGKITYLTRAKWQDTYPAPITSITATADMIEDIVGKWYKKPADAPSVSSFTQGAKNDIPLVDMKYVDFDDDEKWNKFLDQLTLDEMADLTTEQSRIVGVPSISKPQSTVLDGPDGVGGSYIYGAKEPCTGYVNEIVAASAWDLDLIVELSNFLAEDCLYSGVSQLTGPGFNIHRTPYSGRNFEYYSEDPVQSYLCSGYSCEILTNRGILVAVKHFVANNQETDRMGLSTFGTEQTWREVDLRGAEGAFTIGKSMSVMLTMSRMGCIAATSSKALLQDILRNEWGFIGSVVTDNCGTGTSSAYVHTIETLVAGSNQYCLSDRSAELKKEISDNDDGYLFGVLRHSTKELLYAVSRSIDMNGFKSSTKVISVTPWWQTFIITVIVILSVLTIASIALFTISILKNRNTRRLQNNG